MFRPSINGYSISGLKTMQGRDGLVISCSVLKDGKKVGEFYDGGDGAPYRFDGPDSIEKEVAAFPPFDYESYNWNTETPERKKMDWDLGILVENLMGLKDDYNAFRKHEVGDSVAIVDIPRTSRKITCEFDSRAKSDKEIRKHLDGVVRDLLKSLAPVYQDCHYTVKIYHKEEDFTVSL